MNMKKKGISPVIATALLIAIVIVLAAIIFLWARGFISEKIAKFDEPVDRACARVAFEAGIFNDDLDVNNQGNVPLFGFNIKKFGTGEILINEVVGGVIVAGESTTIDMDQAYSSTGGDDRFLVVPIVLAESESGNVAYTCGDEFGVGVQI